MLKDKVAVIYGAGGGIGAAVAHAFAREGATLVLAGRRPGPVEDRRRDIIAAGRSARRPRSTPWTSRPLPATCGP